jgi:DNA-binding MarR family transcriptional regulator
MFVYYFGDSDHMKAVQKTTSRDSLTLELFRNFQTLFRCLDFGRGRAPLLTVRQMQVLSFFNDSDVVYISEVGRKLNMSIQSVNNLVKRLEVLGYVERTKNAQDKRFSDICLTAKGRQGFTIFRAEQLETLKTIVRQLNDSERGIALRAVEHAAELLQKAVIRASEKEAVVPVPVRDRQGRHAGRLTAGKNQAQSLSAAGRNALHKITQKRSMT